MIKDFIAAINESTCDKRTIVCELYDKDNNLLVRESNRCYPDGGRCHRMNLTQTKENYDIKSNCNWTHAEIMAINALQPHDEPKKAIVYGHDFFCESCEYALKMAGVSVFEVITTIPINNKI